MNVSIDEASDVVPSVLWSPLTHRSLRAGHSTIGSHSQVRIVIAMLTGQTKNGMCWQCSLEWKEEKGDEQKRGAVGETWSECGFRLVVLGFRNEMLFYLPSPLPQVCLP